MDITTYWLNQPRGKCSKNHLKYIVRWEGRNGVTITIFFPAYKRWTQDQLSLRRHPHEDLKCTKLCLAPIQTSSEAFLGFLGKTKMKAYTKLTVVTRCQIVAKRSETPSSGNFWRRPAPWYACGQDQEFWRKIVLVK